MNTHPILLLLLIAVNGAACGGSSDQPAATATATTATAQQSAAPAAPTGTDSKTPPAGQAAAPPSSPAGGRGPVVARVNGAPIYKVDYDTALSSFMQSNRLGPDATEDQKKEAGKTVMDGLIGSELLFQKARTVPIEVPQTDVDQALAQTRQGMGEQAFNEELTRRGMTSQDLDRLVRQNLMIQKLIKEQVINTMTVSDTEEKAFYDGHPKEMEKPENVEASHILVRSNASDPADKKTAARKKIDEALKRVKSGEDFAALAKEYSEDSSAASGGTLGVIQHGQTVPAFEEAAFKLTDGQTSDVVESQFGFHIIKVTAKHAAGVAPFEEVKGRIGEYLKQKKSRDAIEKLVASLRAAARVEIL